MFRSLTRILGFCLTVAGFVLVVIDGTASIGSSRLVVTPLGSAAFWLFPNSFPILEPAVTRHIHPLLWDPVLLNFFLIPAALALIALGALLLFAGRRRGRPIGHASRL